MPAELSDIVRILGGRKLLKKRIVSSLDLVELGSQGLPFSSLSHFTHTFAIPMRQMADSLPVTERTLMRYSESQQLSRVVSEHLIQLARVFALGLQVFGAKDKLLTWLTLPSKPLGDRTPLSLLSSPIGLELVSDELGRIEYGVYS